jgi:uncharacterized cupin superfamily protein
MPDPFQKVTPRSEFEPNSILWNTMIDAVLDYLRKQPQGQRPVVGKEDPKIYVLNVSEATIPQFGVTGIGSLFLTPTKNLTDFRNQYVFTSASPTVAGLFGITQEPIVDGQRFCCILAATGVAQRPGNATYWVLYAGTAAAWNGATPYIVGNRVTSGGNTYVCILANTNNVPPNATYWQLVGTDQGQWSSATSYVAGDQIGLANIGSMLIWGPSRCKLMMTLASDGWAAPVAGNYVHLLSQAASGPAEIVWHDTPLAWNAGTPYNIGDTVSLSGTFYTCILGHTNHQPPNGTYWSLGAEVWADVLILNFTPGGGGGGSGTVTSISQGTGIVCTPNPITVTGSVAIVVPVVIANGGTTAITAVGAHDNLSTLSTAIASAATTDLSTATGTYVHITGVTTITSFGTMAGGVERTLVFDAGLTVTNNANIILAGGANITTSAGDVMIFRSEGAGVWRLVDYLRASGGGLYYGDETSIHLPAGGATFSLLAMTGDVTTTAGTVATTVHYATLSNTDTNQQTEAFSIRHNTSNTPVNGFGSITYWRLDDSTTPNIKAADITVKWVTAAHAGPAARQVFSIYDLSARECMRFESLGSVAAVSWFGVAAAARQIGDIGDGLVNYGLIISPSLRIANGGTSAATAVGAHDNLSTKSSNIASAATTDLSTATGTYVHITGTTTITSFGTMAGGVERTLVFDASLTVTNNANIILAGGANITTAAGDTMIFRSEGAGVWRLVATSPVSAVRQYKATKYTTTGDHTFSKQTWARLIRRTVVGGGGGGGGAPANTGVGAGGGGGGTAIYEGPASELAATETAHVGSGGAGGAAGNNSGSDGTDSTFTTTGGGGPGTLTGGAGAGGNSHASVVTFLFLIGGLGGTALNGNLHIEGGQGGTGTILDANNAISGGNGPCYLAGENQGGNTTAGGANGTTGQGGGGACVISGGVAQAGGAGAAGYILVEEWN